jgi:hypothetical protein
VVVEPGQDLCAREWLGEAVGALGEQFVDWSVVDHIGSACHPRLEPLMSDRQERVKAPRGAAARDAALAQRCPAGAYDR